MNLVFLSPHFPPHYTRFCQQARALGANVLGIGDEPWERLPETLRAALTEYYRVADLHDYDALLRACGFFTHKWGRIHRLDSLNEYWLATEARLRDDFNIEGLRGTDIDTVRRKSCMKARFREAGAPVAEGRVIRTLEEARAFIHKVGYPVVAKPDAGVGALDTFRLDNAEDLQRFWEVKPGADYFLEAFVHGTIVSFDGLADRQGEPVFYTSHVFSQGIMETVNERRDIGYFSLRDLPPRLEALGRACLQAFPVRERFFHIEFFQTGPADYTALEVNLRPPGGFTTDMFNYACDIDVYRLWAQLLLHGEVRLDYARKFHCAYASRRSARRYTHTRASLLERYGDHMCQLGQVPGVFSSALGDEGFIFRAPDLETVRAITAMIHATPGGDADRHPSA
jgi:hypothetical protein